MNLFKITESTMLCEAGYKAAWIEDINDGDECAMKEFNLERDYHDLSAPHEILNFFTATNIKRIPRFERDEEGNLLSSHPNYLIRFIAILDNAIEIPKSYGSGWAVYIKREL